jgi:formylglycine-generating enzyme required for sulfatase activity
MTTNPSTDRRASFAARRLIAIPALTLAVACGSGGHHVSGVPETADEGGSRPDASAREAGVVADASTDTGVKAHDAAAPDAAVDGASRDASHASQPDAEVEGGAPADAGADGGDAGLHGPPPAIGGQCPSEGALACAGHAQKLQLSCTSGTWTLAGGCPDGTNCDTRSGATLGTCQPIVEECTNAAGGDVVCIGADRVACGPDLVSSSIVETCGGGLPACVDGACTSPPSCASLPDICGSTASSDCCAIDTIAGGTFDRGYDAVTYTDQTNPATLSNYELDRYEVTVGRFRAFVLDYNAWRAAGHPFTGEGAHPTAAGTGWDPTWDSSLPAGGGQLGAALKCATGTQTWLDAPSSGDNLPINCVTWYEAFAFCAWDGGRLPTEAEWNYAAAGGSDQRVYPWSSPASSTSIDDADAVYCGGSCANPKIAGSRSPSGDGKFGHADLAGNLAEWTFDWAGPYRNPCNDCADTAAEFGRAVRGGSFSDVAAQLLTSSLVSVPPDNRLATVGFRCAHAP